MLLILPEFEMLFAESVEQACALLSQHGDDAHVLAGGTDLFIKMKLKRLVPQYVVNIKRIAGLDLIRYEPNDGLHIGALATIQAIKDTAVVHKKFPILSHAASILGTAQIRNLGTLGGNLANASPSAEFGPPLLVLEARARCVSSGGERWIPITEFFLGPGKSALRHGEVLTEVHIPDLPPGANAVYLKHSLRRMDVAMAGAAVMLMMEADTCTRARIALGAVAPTPFRARRTEETLKGKRFTGGSAESDLLDEIAESASQESHPIDDIRSYASYRRKVVGNLVRQGLEQLLAMARA